MNKISIFTEKLRLLSILCVIPVIIPIAERIYKGMVTSRANLNPHGEHIKNRSIALHKIINTDISLFLIRSYAPYIENSGKNP